MKTAPPRSCRLAAALGLVLAGGSAAGCFNPETTLMAAPDEDEDEGEGKNDDVAEDEDEGEDACFDFDDPCDAPEDCCGFEGTTQTGDALCAGFGDDYRCTNVCRSDDECTTGCCIALTGNTEHGSCGSCTGVGFGSDTALCLDGVERLCDCGGGCSDEDHELFVGACSDTESDVGQAFICISHADSCGDEVSDCIPEDPAGG